MRSFTAAAAVAALSFFSSVTEASPILDTIKQVLGRAPSDPVPLSTADRLAFNPFIRYASAAYCYPNSTINWSCGPDCQGSNPQFQPIASGGDGDATQFWYVGYDPNLRVPGSPAQGAIVVGHQGTDTRRVQAVLTDINVGMLPLDQRLFPGVPYNVFVHSGFRNQQAMTAAVILSAVKQGMAKYRATTVMVTGHSLGAALAQLDGVYLKLNLPASTYVSVYGFASPRCGNQGWANFVDQKLNYNRHVGNKQDAVPVLPAYSLGWRNPSGEVHIRTNDSQWVFCPGQDNMSTQCSTGAVPNIFVSNSGRDHNGPYNDVAVMGNQCTPNPYA